MIAISSRFVPKSAWAAGFMAALLVAACVPQNVPPQHVQARNPSVTYKYRGDQELLQANQNAMTYCSQYQSSARTVSIDDSGDGEKVVVFQCVAMGPTPPLAPAYNPNLAYNYSTDQGLLDASSNAEIYCMNNGSQRAVSTIVMNANGTRTVTFQCVVR
jgi:type II secretory pathway pseudopilin PulG